MERGHRGRGRPGAVPRADRRAGRRGRRELRHRHRHRDHRVRRPARRRGRQPRGGDRARRPRSSWRPRPRPACPAAPMVRTEAISEDEDDGRPGMIRLGSLAGYPFEGPRAARRAGPPPAAAAVYAIFYKPEPGGQAGPVRGHLRRPRRRPVRRALPVPAPARGVLGAPRRARSGRSTSATYEVPGGSRAHREQIARELTAIYRPSCNTQQYDPSWKDEWIGEYTAPTHRPRSPPPAGPRAPTPIGTRAADAKAGAAPR